MTQRYQFAHLSASGTGIVIPTTPNGTEQLVPGATTLHSVIINGGTTGAVTIYDWASSTLTGAPVVAIIEAATAPVALRYDISLVNGLTVTLAANTDVTFVFASV